MLFVVVIFVLLSPITDISLNLCPDGLGLLFQQMFLKIPPKSTVIHPPFVEIYYKNLNSPLSKLRSSLYTHIVKLPSAVGCTCHILQHQFFESYLTCVCY